MSAFTSPDRDRRSPVSGAGDGPVFYFCQPVSEALFANIIRIPVYCIVVGNQLIFEFAHFNVPGRFCIINQRCAASPAVWVIVLKLFFGKYLVVLCQIFYNLNVQAFLHYKVTFPRSLCIASSLIYRLQYRKVVLASALVVIFTKSRGGMNNACTIFG